jgi:hypothetical protein
LTECDAEHLGFSHDYLNFNTIIGCRHLTRIKPTVMARHHLNQQKHERCPLNADQLYMCNCRAAGKRTGCPPTEVHPPPAIMPTFVSNCRFSRHRRWQCLALPLLLNSWGKCTPCFLARRFPRELHEESI